MATEAETASGRPEWARNIKEGDLLTVRENMLTRGGEQGFVVEPITDDGCSIDFECDVDGDPAGAPYIEFWNWDEIEHE